MYHRNILVKKMVVNPIQDYISPEEYLKREEISQIKHEYIAGFVYAMAGASDSHVAITLNISSAFKIHFRGKGCRVYASDMKARIESINRYFYPDVMVSCDDRDRAFDTYKRYPCLIVEVLSKRTEAFDRGDKFADYQELETLQEYVLINQKHQRVECYRRNSEGLWVLHTYKKGSEVYFASVDFRISMDDLYEDVNFSINKEEDEEILGM
jgi:Uma2 family endonuclease